MTRVGSALPRLALGPVDLAYRVARRATGLIGFRYEYLYAHARRRPPRRILEVGVYRGVRSLGLVRAALSRLPRRDVHFYGVDLFEQYDALAPAEIDAEVASTKRPLSQAEIRAALAELLPEENIHLFGGFSDRVFAAHGSALPPMDLIFVDGGHSLETIESDFRDTSRLLAPTGTLFLDDYWLTRSAGCRALYERLSPDAWAKWLFPIPDYYPETVGFIWLARLRRRAAATGASRPGRRGP